LPGKSSDEVDYKHRVMIYHTGMLASSLLKLHGQIYPPQQARVLLDRLIKEIAWQQDFVAFGRRFDVPRLQAWYADVGVHYRYSDNKLQSHPWTDQLLAIKQEVEGLAAHSFNSVLLTYYRNGQDYVNWHADDEPELGEAPVIASLSLGTSREFQYRHKQGDERGSLHLQDGELLVMQPQFQQDWEHRVPAQPEITAPRINLTFRRVVTQAT
jgi:alkylated DNA repair dioxygenase AlkB